MAKKQNTIIRKSQTILHELSEGDSQFEYTVEEGVKATIVLTSLKNRRARVNLVVRLAGRGSSATIIGIFLGAKSSDVRMQTSQIHAAPATVSNLLVKSVLHDKSQFNYGGSIRVEKDAQKTDAYQRNENLLTGIGAHATSTPSLEILANDVRCTHGSTTGPVDQAELWYLESRGISPQNAEKLIVEGYISAAVGLVDDLQIRDLLWQKIRAAI